jgi:regulator of replication initiation timing
MAESQRFGDAKTQAETGKILQEMERVAAENDRLKLEYAQMQQQIVQHIEAQLDAIQ